MKKSLFIVAIVAGGLAGYMFFKKPERYLKRSTKKVLKMVDNPAGDNKNLLSVTSKVSKIAKYIHHDVVLNLDYKGKQEKIQSLNEFRSFLSFYFTKANAGPISYDTVTVQMIDKQKALVFFKVFATVEAQAISCDTTLQWLKEDKWFIKNIDIKNCS